MLLAGQLRIQDLIMRIGFPFCPMWAAVRRSSGGLLDGEGGGGGGGGGAARGTAPGGGVPVLQHGNWLRLVSVLASVSASSYVRVGCAAEALRGGMAVSLVFKKPVPGMPQVGMVGGGCACWAALPVGLWLASLGLYCSN